VGNWHLPLAHWEKADKFCPLLPQSRQALGCNESNANISKTKKKLKQ